MTNTIEIYIHNDKVSCLNLDECVWLNNIDILSVELNLLASSIALFYLVGKNDKYYWNLYIQWWSFVFDFEWMCLT
jgi:hypothetical protein